MKGAGMRAGLLLVLLLPAAMLPAGEPGRNRGSAAQRPSVEPGRRPCLCRG